jgi:hypothetical protein
VCWLPHCHQITRIVRREIRHLKRDALFPSPLWGGHFFLAWIIGDARGLSQQCKRLDIISSSFFYPISRLGMMRTVCWIVGEVC